MQLNAFSCQKQTQTSRNRLRAAKKIHIYIYIHMCIREINGALSTDRAQCNWGCGGSGKNRLKTFMIAIQAKWPEFLVWGAVSRIGAACCREGCLKCSFWSVGMQIQLALPLKYSRVLVTFQRFRQHTPRESPDCTRAFSCILPVWDREEQTLSWNSVIEYI